MQITTDQAVEMFARYYSARLGKKASRGARSRAKALQKRGDIKGQNIWNRVADEIEKKPRAH